MIILPFTTNPIDVAWRFEVPFASALLTFYGLIVGVALDLLHDGAITEL